MSDQKLRREYYAIHSTHTQTRTTKMKEGARRKVEKKWRIWNILEDGKNEFRKEI